MLLFTILLLYREKIFTSIQSIPDIIELWGRIEHKRGLFTEIEKEYCNINERKYEDINLKFDKIVFDNVTFKYKSSDNSVFKKINLNMDLNDKIIGITGLSGQGKSTFAKLIIKMYKYNGNIYIDNKNIQDINNSYIRDNIVYINQTTKLFDKKVIDNILYGCKEKDISRCNKYLEDIFKYKKIRALFKNINIYGYFHQRSLKK